MDKRHSFCCNGLTETRESLEYRQDELANIIMALYQSTLLDTGGLRVGSNGWSREGRREILQDMKEKTDIVQSNGEKSVETERE